MREGEKEQDRLLTTTVVTVNKRQIHLLNLVAIVKEKDRLLTTTVMLLLSSYNLTRI